MVSLSTKVELAGRIVASVVFFKKSDPKNPGSEESGVRVKCQSEIRSTLALDSDPNYSRSTLALDSDPKSRKPGIVTNRIKRAEYLYY
jgi:hypothetical protein